MKTHAYCDHCAEEVPINSMTETCLWCDGPTREFRARRNKAVKPTDRRTLRESKLGNDRLRLLHRIHIEKGMSINQLAAQLYEKHGYASKSSCATAIGNGFKRLDLKARDRVEATVAASTKHGMAPKHGPRPGYNTYRRRVLNGQPDQPRCEGTVRQGKAKGERCQRPAIFGSTFCQAHEPSREEARVLHLAAMREKRTIDLIPLAPLSVWLNQLHAELGTWREVGWRVGRSASLVHAYARGISPTTKEPLESIGRQTAEQLIEFAEDSFDEVYSMEVAA